MLQSHRLRRGEAIREKRDWDVIREVLIEAEALDSGKHEVIQYGLISKSDQPAKAAHCVLPWRAGIVDGAVSRKRPRIEVKLTN